ncbi:unnamed protein product [Moneuplotes crassus]|uniref:Cleavage and polyadenylation specificity factor subunit 2 n=1 Tax=Euplotes crassus TaxID=5936 RepID=A0AAD2DAH0_EUPCR|nr:unnamed protein product [Moneuplotes crassus]
MESIEFENILSKEYDGCTSNFLKIGQAGIMFDCGIPDEVNQEVLDTYDKYMSQVNIICLTHATFRHCGALPYLRKKYDFSKIKVYATFPVNKLSPTCMYEYYICQMNLASFEIFTIEDIDLVFEEVNPVNFKQTHHFNIKDSCFSLIALNAGYSLGGAIWEIIFNCKKLIYAIDVNDKNECITEPFLISELQDAYCLITNTYIAPSIDGKQKCSHLQSYMSKERLKYNIQKTILDHLDFEEKANAIPEGPQPPRDYNQADMDQVPISEVLMNYGLVGKDTDYDSSEYPHAGQYDAEILICCDNFSRVLEVLFFLEDYASQNRDLQKIPILYLDHMSNELLEIARSHIEWMNNHLNTTFVYIDISPINFNHIKVLSKESELQNYPNPRIVVTTTSTFLLGHSKNLLPKVLTNRNSKLIFINKQLSHNLGPNLIKGELMSYTHKKVSVEKIRQVTESVTQDADMMSDKPQEEEKIKDTPSEQLPSIEEDDEDIDLSGYNSKLFAHTDYDMFPIRNLDKDDTYHIDAYGVFKAEESEDPKNMLNNIIYHLGAGHDPGALEDKDMGFGATTLNNSVSYPEIMDHFKTYKYLHHYTDEHVSIDCKTAYIPFEGRIDKKSFQIMLSETRPKNLIVVNASQLKVERIKKFVMKNNLNINVEYVMNQNGSHAQDNPGGIHTFKINSIPKESIPISLHPVLLSSMKSGKNISIFGSRYNVQRVYGKLSSSSDVADPTPKPSLKYKANYQLSDIPPKDPELQSKEKYLFESSTLFFTDLTHRLSDLQKFLFDKGYNLQMINKKLMYEKKVEIYQDSKGDFKINGMLCQQFLQIRKLIYEHYNAV